MGLKGCGDLRQDFGIHNLDSMIDKPTSDRYTPLHNISYRVGLSGFEWHIMIVLKMRRKDVNV